MCAVLVVFSFVVVLFSWGRGGEVHIFDIILCQYTDSTDLLLFIRRLSTDENRRFCGRNQNRN